MKRSRLAARAGKSDIHGFGGKSRRLLFGFHRGSGGRERGLDCHPRLVENLAHLGALLFGDGAEQFHQRSELAAFTEKTDSHFVECLRGLRRRNGGESLTFYLVDA